MSEKDEIRLLQAIRSRLWSDEEWCNSNYGAKNIRGHANRRGFISYYGGRGCNGYTASGEIQCQSKS